MSKPRSKTVIHNQLRNPDMHDEARTPPGKIMQISERTRLLIVKHVIKNHSKNIWKNAQTLMQI